MSRRCKIFHQDQFHQIRFGNVKNRFAILEGSEIDKCVNYIMNVTTEINKYVI